MMKYKTSDSNLGSQCAAHHGSEGRGSRFPFLFWWGWFFDSCFYFILFCLGVVVSPSFLFFYSYLYFFTFLLWLSALRDERLTK